MIFVINDTCAININHIVSAVKEDNDCETTITLVTGVEYTIDNEEWELILDKLGTIN